MEMQRRDLKLPNTLTDNYYFDIKIQTEQINVRVIYKIYPA
jgi:hypothetical protein